MKTVSKNSRSKQAFFFSRQRKVDDTKIKSKVSPFSLPSFIFLLLLSFSYFFSLLHDLEAAFWSSEIKVKYG